METNNKTTFIICGALLVGILVGWAISGRSNYKMREGMHKMPNGEMMKDMDNNMHSKMTMNSMMDSMTASLKGKTGTEFDNAFLEEMIPHHLGAVEMAKMVLQNSMRPELIKMANDIISTQQKEINTMRFWQKEWFGIQAQ